MDVVRNDVENLVLKELKAANKKNPLFHSAHEGYAVLLGEISKLKQEIKRIKIYKKFIKRAVCEDNYQSALHGVNIATNYAINAAVEAIQVAVMCKKFEIFLEQESGNAEKTSS